MNKQVSPESRFDVTVKVEHRLEWREIEGVLVSALEGGIGYWAQIDNVNGPDYSSKTCENIVKGTAHLLMTDVEDGQQNMRLDRAAVEKGLKLMAEKFPRHMADILNGDDDAETGDVLVQLALLGEIVYG